MILQVSTDITLRTAVLKTLEGKQLQISMSSFQRTKKLNPITKRLQGPFMKDYTFSYRGILDMVYGFFLYSIACFGASGSQEPGGCPGA